MARVRVCGRRIHSANTRRTDFSRHVAELFECARELCILCDVKIAIIVFSPEGHAYTFGHPSVEAVVDKFRRDGSGSASNTDLTLTEANRESSSVAPQTEGVEVMEEEPKREMKQTDQDLAPTDGLIKEELNLLERSFQNSKSE